VPPLGDIVALQANLKRFRQNVNTGNSWMMIDRDRGSCGWAVRTTRHAEHGKKQEAKLSLG